MLLSRRTLIICAAALLPARSFAAEKNREEVAEALIARGVNDLRARLAPDLPALLSDPVLDAIARERSLDMVHGAPFDHQDEHGGYPAIEKMRARMSRYGAMGENIMQDFNPSGVVFDPPVIAARAVKSWFESEGHRENIVAPSFSKVGTGVGVSRTLVYATQVFWGPPAGRGDQRRS